MDATIQQLISDAYDLARSDHYNHARMGEITPAREIAEKLRLAKERIAELLAAEVAAKGT